MIGLRLSRCEDSSMHRLLKRHMRVMLNLYPPLLGAGIRVKRLDADWRTIEVEMKLHRWNVNYVGSHYGGSLYSMTDPFYMLMLLENLGREYIVWDKSACIRFRRPAKGTVTASFNLTQAQLDEIRTILGSQEKVEPTFEVEVRDADGNVVAEVQKVLHIRRK
jgi:hypothetical protein